MEECQEISRLALEAAEWMPDLSFTLAESYALSVLQAFQKSLKLRTQTYSPHLCVGFSTFVATVGNSIAWPTWRALGCRGVPDWFPVALLVAVVGAGHCVTWGDTRRYDVARHDVT